jgi:hypothetical protein
LEQSGFKATASKIFFTIYFSAFNNVEPVTNAALQKEAMENY